MSLSALQTIGTKPIAHIDHFTPEMLGTAELAEEVSLEGSGKLVKVRQEDSKVKGHGAAANLCFRLLRSQAAAAPGRR